MTSRELLRLSLVDDQDVFLLRQCGREIADLVGLSSQDQIRVATALSDLGRVAMAGTDVQAGFTLRGDGSRLGIALTWRGSPATGHPSWDSARKLMDEMVRSSDGEQHTVRLGKRLPAPIPFDEQRYAALRARLAKLTKGSALDELRAQNEHLLTLLDEVEQGRQDLLRLNAELDETNKGVLALYTELSEELDRTNQGVVALYAELEDKTEQLAAASDAKSRYWANVSHELRSPLNSVVGLARLLLDVEADPLTDVQRRQVELINTSGETVLRLTNELLDVAKAEAGRVEAHIAQVDLRVLFTQLRGTLLAAYDNPEVALVVEDPPEGEFHSDELLLERVLRNAVTNALKFTERGSVRLTARRTDAEWVFTVTDTGIGIPDEHLDKLFQEFHQVPHRLQRGGIGLGLPYAKTLTKILGGDFSLASEVGVGTTATVRLPAVEARLGLVLVVDQDPAFRAHLAGLLVPFAADVVEACDVDAARAALGERTPDAVFLDSGVPRRDDTDVLGAFRGRRVVQVTSAPPEEFDMAGSVLAKGELSPAAVAAALRAATDPR